MQAPSPGLIRAIFVADLVSRMGDAVTLVALPLTAVLVVGADPAGLALIAAAQALPVALVSLPAGAWVDKLSSRWPILVVADLARAVVLASIPVMAAASVLTLPLLALVAMLMSLAGTFFELAFSGWLPRLLAGDALHRTNARLEAGRSITVAAGPALGGFLVGLVTAPVALLVDAGSFLVSAAVLGALRKNEPLPLELPVPVPMRSAILGGLRFLAHERLVLAITATATINNFTRSIAMSIAVLYLVDVGSLSPEEIGLAFGIGNTGFVVGALANRPITARLGVGPAMQTGVALFGPSMLMFALAPADLAGVAFAGMLFAHGFGISLHNVNQVTVRQLLTPDALRARVAAVFRLAIFGAIPAGSVVGGVVAQFLGLQFSLVLSGLGLLAGSLPYLLVRVTRIRTIADLSVPATGRDAP